MDGFALFGEVIGLAQCNNRHDGNEGAVLNSWMKRSRLMRIKGNLASGPVNE
jgi:hypothetical protein